MDGFGQLVSFKSVFIAQKCGNNVVPIYYATVAEQPMGIANYMRKENVVSFYCETLMKKTMLDASKSSSP